MCGWRGVGGWHIPPQQGPEAIREAPVEIEASLPVRAGRDQCRVVQGVGAAVVEERALLAHGRCRCNGEGESEDGTWVAHGGCS